MKRVQKWFNPQKHSGWQKKDSAVTRRKKLLASADQRKNLHEQFLEAARRAQALANVTQDKETSIKAKSDAQYFYGLARKIKSQTPIRRKPKTIRRKKP